MKWKREPVPTEHAMRVVQRFAWVPTETEDGYTYWLQNLWVEERYSAGNRGWQVWAYLGESYNGEKPVLFKPLL